MFDQTQQYSLITKIKNFVARMSAVLIINLVLVLAGILAIGFGLYQINRATYFSGVSAECSQVLGVEDSEVHVWIDVSGAVENPGVYEFPFIPRVADAITQAGGLNKRADSNYVGHDLNLAKKLEDGQKIYVPFEGELAQESKISTSETSVSGLISINKASASQLEELPGIGEKRSQDIVDNRSYSSVQDLLDKGVVTQSIFEKIESLITL